MELWGGIECTINRVGDSYHDQCVKNGHDRRWDADLTDFAAIGFKKLRYPVLWEKVAPRDPRECDFGDAGRRLEKLRRLGVEPILGLLHHGSGPAYTSLLDPEFADKFAVYAREAAERFPWVEWVTPVNEPLTTARFSALYGVWYPHAKDDASFGRALFHEIRATILAMREFRKVNPQAKLLQTDDLGRATGTELLRYQIDFENERRWLTYDLLLGRVDRSHFMYRYLVDHAKFSEDELAWIRDNACPPDVIGVNHYPLSNRFLDHRLELYPSVFHGGNGRHRYVDVGAVDSGQANPPMPYDILREVQERYDRPFAVTEVHIAGGREEQMRWFLEVWRAGERLEREGAKIQAVTAWSLLGAYDWRTLCTTCEANGVYESGVFDLRSPHAKPRPTALAKMLPLLAKGEWVDHPVLDHPGYWREPRRILFAPPKGEDQGPQKKSRPLAITGGRGTLGRAFARLCEKRGIDYVLLTRQDLDIAEPESVRDCLARVSPWAVINTAGYVRVDDAEGERERCFRENTHGAKVLAEVAGEAKIPLLTFSTDLVFDGQGDRPYLESHRTSPLNAYGASKEEAERWVRTTHPGALIVRTSSFFGPWDEANFAHHVLASLHRGEAVRAAHDVVMSPTYVPHLVDACLDLLIDGETGILHLTNDEHLSWAEWAKRIASLFEMDPALVAECTSGDLAYRAQRPRFSALSSERMQILPTFEEAMFEWKKQKGIP